MKNSFYHKMSINKMSIIDMLIGNYWTIIALAFIAIVIIVALCQYGIRNGHLIKKYSDTPYLMLSVAATLTMTVLLVIESHAGIIQLLDNALRGNESPLFSGLLLGPTAMLLGGAFGFGLAVLSEIVTALRKRSIVKKLRRISEQRRKAKRHRVNQPRCGQPHDTPRPGTPHPTRYNIGRDKANHNHTNRVSTGKGMRRC